MQDSREYRRNSELSSQSTKLAHYHFFIRHDRYLVHGSSSFQEAFRRIGGPHKSFAFCIRDGMGIQNDLLPSLALRVDPRPNQPQIKGGTVDLYEYSLVHLLQNVGDDFEFDISGIE